MQSISKLFLYPMGITRPRRLAQKSNITPWAHHRRRSTIDDLQFTQMLPKGAMIRASSAECLTLGPLFPVYPTPYIYPNEIKLLEEVGDGFSGIVYKGYRRATRHMIAYKTLHAFGAPHAHLLSELDVMLKCKGDHLVQMHGIVAGESHVSVVMEWMDCGSFVGKGPLKESILATISLSVLLGLRTLHDTYNITHCDLKPSNILYNSQGVIKLCDFGESLHMSINRSSGSEAFMAPERLLNQASTAKSDVWSLGVTLYELATGNHPFGSDSAIVELLESMTTREPSLPWGFHSTFRDFLRKCLTRDLRRRASVDELLKHKFLRKSLDPRKFAKWTRDGDI